MTKRTRNNLIAILLVVLYWGGLLAFTVGSTGCAGQGLQVEYTDGQGKQVLVDTDYQVENGFTMERHEDGYRIELGSATTKDAEMGVIAELLQMIQALMILQVPGPDPAQE